MPERYADILVVDLLGGLGDLLMVLPAVHGLARRNPGARVRVLTHSPGADLLRSDPAVTEVLTPAHGGEGAEREAVAAALAARAPDLAVSTTRYDGIPELLAAAAGRAVTDLWRRPPPDELVQERYLRILCAEGLLDPRDVAAPVRVHLTPAEHAAGDARLARHLGAAAGMPAGHPTAAGPAAAAGMIFGHPTAAGMLPGHPTAAGSGPQPGAGPPVLLVPGAGMPVKRWPDERWAQLAARLRDRGLPLLAVTPLPGVPALPPTDLRGLAAAFAAAGRRGGVVVGGDTGPVRLAAAAGAGTVVLFGPTLAGRYGLGEGAARQGLPDCPHRRPTAITEQVCWWQGTCPLSPAGPACMADLAADPVADDVLAQLAATAPG